MKHFKLIFVILVFFKDEPPRSQSKLTLLWGAMVKLCAGHYPKLYSYQNSLPRMPVPNLNDTCKALLRSIKPIFDEEEYKKMETLAKVGLLIPRQLWPLEKQFNLGLSCKTTIYL